MNELRIDKIDTYQCCDFYYEVYGWLFEVPISNIIKNQLQPRLDHLNRTIARLEKEIAIENNNTPIQKPTQL